MNKTEDNNYFHYYNANPKDKKTTDCTYRALSLFLGKSWSEIAKLDAEFYLNHGMWFYTTEVVGCMPRGQIGMFMKEQSCNVIYDRNSSKRYLSLREFIDDFAKDDKSYLCELHNHITTIKDKKIWDTWDSSLGCPIRIYEFDQKNLLN